MIIFGLFVFWKLPVRELPNGIQPPVVQVQVNYTSASASIVDQEVTQVIEDVVGGAEGIREVIQNINGLSDAEYEAAQKFLPTYFQDAWIWRNKAGELVAFNYGTWDATNYPKITTKFIHEMAEAAYDDEDQSISKMLKDYIFPYLERMGSSFIGPSMSQQVLNQYFLGHGVNNAGATMRNPFDSTDRVRIFKDPDGSISNLDTYLDRNNLKILLILLSDKLSAIIL